jgi:autophagy-related protein 2
MNFIILEACDITLRHAIVYGVSGFEKLNKTLKDIWIPDVKRNQLPGVLAGLAPVRSIVNVGGGIRDLVVIPMREYRKDGRVVRSIQKGAVAFAKTTSSELARLGAKLAIGTQNVLQGAEGLLSPSTASASPHRGEGDWEDVSPSGSPRAPSHMRDIERRAHSNYADQPIGVMAGLRGAARSLERDLATTRDAIIAIPAEVMESGSAGEAAKVIAKRAPTVILRPAIGATKALGTMLLGAGNAVDREGARRRVDDVSF